MKKLTILLTVLILYIPAAAATSPVAHWKLDETSGSTAYDSAGTNNGTLIESPVWTSGRINGALEFDGSDEYVDVVDYKGIIGRASRTCAAWIKTSDIGVIMSWGQPGTTGGTWVVRVNDSIWGGVHGALRIQVQNGVRIGSTDLRDGNWHHISVVMEDDGSPNIDEIKLYVDGLEESYSYTDSLPVNTVADENVKIGMWNSNYFNGLIDDVRIYDRPLSTEEVEQLYFEGFGNLWISPWEDFISLGNIGGPFAPASKDYQLTNIGDDTISWDVQYSADWLDVSDTSGTLDPNESVTVTVSINAVADSFGSGFYSDTVIFRDVTNPVEPTGFYRNVTLSIGRTLYVPAEFPTIRAAIYDAVDGDIVLVSDGIYTGEGNTNINFYGKAITVKSQNGPENCIIDCQVDSIGFRFESGEEHDSVLDGFIITGGEGGIVCGYAYGNREVSASPTITNCIIRDNEADHYYWAGGGGITCWGGSSPLISNCIIENNRAIEESYGGGGIYCQQADVTVINCIIRNNTVDGDWAQSGGGIYSEDSTLLIVNSVIADNTCSGLYGGSEYESNGGGIFCAASDVTIVNSTIAANSAEYMGGGIFSDTSEVTLRNCIVWGNSAPLGDNLATGSHYGDESTMSVSYSNIQGGEDAVYVYDDNAILYWGQGNLDIDPAFIDRTNGNYHLFPWSPCIDAADNTAVPEGILTDLDGRPRFFDDPNTIDTGNGTPPIVDMCPYEFNPQAALSVSPEVMKFSVYIGQPEPLNSSFQISNLGTDPLNWSMSGVCEWLIVDKTSGSLSGDFDIVSLNIDVSSLTLGSNQCQLIITSPEAINSPQTMTVIVNVLDPLMVPLEFYTIQSAVDAAAPSDFVVVADGIYTGDGNINVNFLGKAITVRSQNGPENCIIDCQGQNRGFVFKTNEGPDSVLNGFTIVNGFVGWGGGIRVNDYCGPRISNCIVKNCTAQTEGGGIYCGYGSSATIEDCLLFNNTLFEAVGGGIYTNEASSVRIYNCDILNNSASQGGGIYAMHGTVDIRNCRIVNNTAGNGGGMFLYENSQINITNCSVENNISAGGGGGIKIIDCTEATLTNCLLTNNTSGTRGGGMWLRPDNQSIPHHDDERVIRVVNCTFADNRAPDEGGGLWGDGAVFNSIFVNNNNSAINGDCTINYCHFFNNPDGDYWYMTGADAINDIEGNSNNQDGDPMLSSDLHLLVGSPCIDAADNTALEPGIVTDLDQRPRFYDDPDTDDTGNGTPPIVDIGAYEFSSMLWISASSAEPFTAYWGQTDLIEEELKINNIGVSSLNFQITEDCHWLSVEPDSGSISGHTEKSISLTIDVSELEPDHPDQAIGNYYCTLTISSEEAVNSPVLLDITLQVVKPLTVPGRYDTIQAAVDAAGYRDIVLVAEGTYTGDGNVNVSFRGKAITVRSRNGPDNCIIDCEGLNRGFRFITNEGPDSVLNGFTIVNGLVGRGGGIRVNDYCAPRIVNCIVRDCTADTLGGGIYCGYGSSATIEDCQIINNTSDDLGGGIYYDQDPAVKIYNCDILNNSANTYGGGIYTTYGTIEIEQCRINNNTAGNNGGGVFANFSLRMTISNSFIENNYASGSGGGLKIGQCLDGTITNCLLRNNTAGIRGGGMRLAFNHSGRVVNCTFADNQAAEGGAMYADNVTVVNSIFVNNNNSAIIAADEYGCTINYCHFYNNFESDYNGRTGADQINDMPGNSNNQDGDPLLSSDLHLLPGSPCIDAGMDAGVYDDIEGNMRPYDYPGVDNNGGLPEFDMGAYETLPVITCFGINEVKIKTEAGKKGDDIKIKGTFNDPGVPIDLMLDDVLYIIDDGQGHVLEFFIPAGSFEIQGKGDRDKYKYHSPKGSVPDIKAKFDFDKCKFEFKVKKVAGIDQLASTGLEIILQAGVNIAREIVQLEFKGRKSERLEYKRKPKFQCCPNPGKPGDKNNDLFIDYLDLAQLRIQTEAAPMSDTDLLEDLALLAENWLQ